MKKRTGLGTVFLAVLIDLMGFGIVLPLLPFYAAKFSASPMVVGLLYSVYSFAQLIFSPIWGSLSDRVGRRPVMLVSTLGASFAYALFGWAHTLPLLFISRLIAGIMGGNISTAQAYVADVTTPENRAKGMGLIGAAFGAGFVLGPALGALFIHPSFLRLLQISEQDKFAVPGFFAAGLSFASFLLILFKLPETVKPQAPDAQRIARQSIFSKEFWSGMKPLVAMLMGCVFLYSFSQSSLYSAFPLFCRFELGLPEEKIGVLYAYLGIIAILVQGGLIRILLKKFREEKLFFLGSVLMTLGFLLIPFSHSVVLLILFLSLLSLGGSLMGPTLNSLISKQAGPAEVGHAMGTSQGIAALARVVGPAWGGFLYGWGPVFPFIGTAAALIYTIWIGNRLGTISLPRRQAGKSSRLK